MVNKRRKINKKTYRISSDQMQVSDNDWNDSDVDDVEVDNEDEWVLDIEELKCAKEFMLNSIQIPENDDFYVALFEIIEVCYRAWCHPKKDVLDVSRQHTLFFEDVTKVDDNYNKYVKFVHEMSQCLKLAEHNESVTADEIKENNKKLETLGQCLYNAKHSFVFLLRHHFITHPQKHKSLKLEKFECLMKPVRYENLKEHQQLIMKYMEIASIKKYRKIKDQSILYEPLFTNDDDKHYTFYYRAAFTMEDFLYDAIYPYEQNLKEWAALTKSVNVPKQVIQYMKNCKDNRLPWLNRSRYYISCLNGVYYTKEDIFYPYKPVAGYQYCASQLDVNIVACNFIQSEFKFMEYNEYKHPMDIPTPNIQKILDAQKFNSQVCYWAFVMIGRLLFEVGELDDWQVFPFFKGLGGTGKSTLLRLAALFFHVNDIGILSNDGRTDFGLQHLYNKKMFLCMDADEKMKLSQALWNSMVTGEQMAIDIKYGDAVEFLWTVAGAFAGNDYPGWKNAGSSAARRFITFLFTEVVQKVDPKLFDNCKNELLCYLKKCVSCYHHARKRYGHVGIWTPGVLPQFFHDNQSKLEASQNSLLAFLKATDYCVIGSNEHCKFNVFRSKYQSFCNREDIKSRKLTEKEDTAKAFDRYKIKLINVPPGADKNQYDGHSSKYFKGVSIKKD